MSLSGLFVHQTHGSGRNFVRQRIAAKRVKIARFAECLADSGQTDSIAAVARRAGISQQTGSNYFREICARLGWQAS